MSQPIKYNTIILFRILFPHQLFCIIRQQNLRAASHAATFQLKLSDTCSSTATSTNQKSSHLVARVRPLPDDETNTPFLSANFLHVQHERFVKNGWTDNKYNKIFVICWSSLWPLWLFDHSSEKN